MDRPNTASGSPTRAYGAVTAMTVGLVALWAALVQFLD